MNDEEPTGDQPETGLPPDAGNDSPATSEFDAVRSPAPRPRRRVRAGAAGSALASRTTGWIVAAALAGSLVTLLLTGQLHSSQISYVRPVAVQRAAGASRPAAGKPGRVAAPAQVPASASARQLPITVRPGRLAFRRGQVSVVLPRTCRLRLPAPVAARRRPVQVPARFKVLVPRACRLGMQAPVSAGLPGRGRFHLVPRRAFRVAVPAPLPATAPPIAIGRARMPRLACLYAPPPSGRVRVIRLHGTRRLVIVRGRPASGGRVSLVPAPRRVRFFVGPARRAIVRGKQIPAGRNIILLPARRLAGHRWQRVVTIKGRRVVAGLLVPGRAWTVRRACIMAPRRVRVP